MGPRPMLDGCGKISPPAEIRSLDLAKLGVNPDVSNPAVYKYQKVVSYLE